MKKKRSHVEIIDFGLGRPVVPNNFFPLKMSFFLVYGCIFFLHLITQKFLFKVVMS